jgi:hypothetical protein
MKDYYKFHLDVPRLVIHSLFDNVTYYHDKRRRLEYGRIKRMMGLEDDEMSNVLY